MSAADTILERLRATGAASTIAELVAATGLHENAVRRNLAQLAAAGSVQVERPSGTGGRGRPALRYRAQGSPETPYRALLPLLLDLLRGTDVDTETAFAAGRAHGRATAPDGDAREAVVASLAAMGFAPADTTPAGAPDGSVEVRLQACPFADMVMRPGGRRLCALHHGILAGVAEARGSEVRRFDIVDPNAADCHLLLGTPEAPDAPDDQSAAGRAPSTRAAARKASPRSS